MNKNYTLQNQYENTNLEIFLNHIDLIFKENSKDLINYFEYNIYDLENASGTALDLWGALLNIPRYIPAGDEEHISDRYGFRFEHSNYFKLQFDILTKKAFIILSDLAYKLLIKLKIILMSTDCNIFSLSQICDIIFQPLGGTANVLDNQNMTMRYVFNFQLPVWLKYIFDIYNILPKPAGVFVTYVENIAYAFGFEGADPNRIRAVSNFYKSIFKIKTMEVLLNDIRAYNKVITPLIIKRNTLSKIRIDKGKIAIKNNLIPSPPPNIISIKTNIEGA